MQGAFKMKKIISGKVREVYDLEDGRMVIVTTDRISAFDVILPTMITDKGKVLNALSNFWFNYTKDICANHMISSKLKLTITPCCLNKYGFS